MTNIYEPAALVVERRLGNDNPVSNPILEEIRALPNPPSGLPVFTAEDFYGAVAKLQTMAERCAAIANARLAALRPAPASEPDLAKMQEALTRAFTEWLADRTGYPFAGTSGPPIGAKYLAAEGFRLGEPAAAPNASNLPPGEYYSKIMWDAREGEIQSRIDAAVREEREAIAADCEARMQADRFMRDTVRRANRPDMATMYGDRTQAYTEILAAIRARTEIPQASAPLASKEGGGLQSTSAAGESPAPSRKVVAIQMAIAPGQGVFHTCLCDDGTYWWLENQTWKQFPPIPQPEEPSP